MTEFPVLPLQNTVYSPHHLHSSSGLSTHSTKNGCAAARFENLEQGATAHGIEIEALLTDLNATVVEPAVN